VTGAKLSYGVGHCVRDKWCNITEHVQKLTDQHVLHVNCIFEVVFKPTAPFGHVWCCRHAPFLIAFQERAQVFTTVVGQDRMEQREMGMRGGHGWGRQYFVTIHRTTLLQVSIITIYNPHSSHQTGLLSRARAYDPEDSRNGHGDSYNDPWDSHNDHGDSRNDWVAVGRGKLSKQVLPSSKQDGRTCLLSFPL